jgi:hypothetical protein
MKRHDFRRATVEVLVGELARHHILQRPDEKLVRSLPERHLEMYRETVEVLQQLPRAGVLLTSERALAVGAWRPQQ